jgi:hypothetical protein
LEKGWPLGKGVGRWGRALGIGKGRAVRSRLFRMGTKHSFEMEKEEVSSGKGG